eukprot:CAMPEP_0115326888 /NCGR_PEP_ID=MMETSP0270-20121206/83821_1 /TAXON_ID=71861 /ORGANISM="Scrippsiella trochoidea, Strain CCMP3099" /LENGTH=145 /DNA_ID=CAMNT_0002747241 /DNA_START=503 /DNA_END=940 /DNA_ORIENTATION=+
MTSVLDVCLPMRAPSSPTVTVVPSSGPSVICSSNVAPDVDNSAGVSSAASAKLLTWPELARSPSWTPCTLPVAFGKASPEEAGATTRASTPSKPAIWTEGTGVMSAAGCATWAPSCMMVKKGKQSMARRRASCRLETGAPPKRNK